MYLDEDAAVHGVVVAGDWLCVIVLPRRSVISTGQERQHHKRDVVYTVCIHKFSSPDCRDEGK